MTADPSAFDRLVLGEAAPTAEPETAGDLAVLIGLMVQRERIALDLDHLWNAKADEFGRHHDSYQEGYLDGIEHAGRVARGQA